MQALIQQRTKRRHCRGIPATAVPSGSPIFLPFFLPSSTPLRRANINKAWRPPSCFSTHPLSHTVHVKLAFTPLPFQYTGRRLLHRRPSPTSLAFATVCLSLRQHGTSPPQNRQVTAELLHSAAGRARSTRQDSPECCPEHDEELEIGVEEIGKVRTSFIMARHCY